MGDGDTRHVIRREQEEKLNTSFSNRWVLCLFLGCHIGHCVWEMMATISARTTLLQNISIQTEKNPKKRQWTRSDAHCKGKHPRKQRQVGLLFTNRPTRISERKPRLASEEQTIWRKLTGHNALIALFSLSNGKNKTLLHNLSNKMETDWGGHSKNCIHWIGYRSNEKNNTKFQYRYRVLVSNPSTM